MCSITLVKTFEAAFFSIPTASKLNQRSTIAFLDITGGSYETFKHLLGITGAFSLNAYEAYNTKYKLLQKLYFDGVQKQWTVVPWSTMHRLAPLRFVSR